MKRPLHLCLPFVAALAAGCASDLEPAPVPDGGGGGAGGAHVRHADAPDGTTTTVVDASDKTSWIYLDLETKREVAPTTPASSRDWDLGFQRFKLKINGGSSGSGDMAVAAVSGSDLASVTRAPEAGWTTDMGDDSDAGASGLAFESGDGWYAYDPATHALTPRPIVYVVRTVEGNLFKLQIHSYYDTAGTPAHLTFHWAPVAR
jgi:HmuY protein